MHLRIEEMFFFFLSANQVEFQALQGQCIKKKEKETTGATCNLQFHNKVWNILW